MYPDELFFGVTLYEVFIVAGIFAAMLLYRRYSERTGLSAALHNLVIFSSVTAAVCGYLSGYLFQAFYDWMGGKPFALNENTGSTFLGGFIGGFAVLMAVYFGAGSILFRESREHIRRFSTVLDGLAVCVPLGHGFGRIGCLMAGCCHGAAWDHGIYFRNLGYRAVPTQLYEALFLLALAAVLWVAGERSPGFGASLYFMSYGLWRFFIEFLRADDRGSTVVPFLTPSQLVSVLLFTAGLVLLLVRLTTRLSAGKGRERDHG